MKDIFHVGNLWVFQFVLSVTHYHFCYINSKDVIVENIKTAVLHIISWLMILNYMLMMQILQSSNAS